MKFWIVEPHSKKAVGPIEARDLPRLHFFNSESLVAVDGSRDAKDWMAAKNIDALRPFFSRPTSSPPPLPPQAEEVEQPWNPPTRPVVFVACTILLTTLNVPWQLWLFLVMGRKDAHLNETLWLYVAMISIPMLLTLSFSLEARRRSVATSNTSTGVLSIIFLTVNGLLTLVLSLWLCLLYAVHHSGS